MNRWTVSGCALVLVCCLGQSAAARRHGGGGMVCDEWRDYIYNASTGEFIDWLGEPYWKCYHQDEPVSWPESPFPDRYDGGEGYPTKTKCSTCKREARACASKVKTGVQRCIKAQESYFRDWCIEHRQQRFGARMGDDYTCETIQEIDPEFEKPVTTTLCQGPSIDRCVESFKRDYPHTTFTNNMSLQLGPSFFQIIGGTSISIEWGGAKGFASACQDAGSQATNMCASQQSACESRAGGCDE